MPSSSRRGLLTAVASSSIFGIAGCSALENGRPDVNPATGLQQDTSQALDDEAVYVAGEGGGLPTPPTTAEELDSADAVLASASTARNELVEAFRSGKPVAVGGQGATSAVQGFLKDVRAEYSFGVEKVRGRPVPVVVADPRGDTVETYTFIDDGGWKNEVLDPFGWALVGRVPESDTAVPESSMDDSFEYVGAAHIVGRLSTGESYVSQSKASVSRGDGGRSVRLRTKLHAAANDGYAIESVRREADFADDERLQRVYPNPHTRNGVQVANVSDTLRSTFGIEATPANAESRSALTASGGLRTDGVLSYDHRTSFKWKRDDLLETDRHYGSSSGRGEWAISTSPSS